MSYKQKRRKVKHPKRVSMYKKKKTKAQRLAGIVLTVIILCALVFVGYSVGKPVLDYFKNGGRDKPSESSDLSSNSTDTTSSSSVADIPDDESSEPVKTNTNMLVLDTDTLLSKTALTNALSTAKSQGYTVVAVNLVADGGELYYASENNKAVSYEAVKSDAMTANEIASAIKSAGMTPVARYSVLTDHIVGRADKSIGFTFEIGNSTWLDNSLEMGGKSWISPFKENARAYINDLTAEIRTAGFETIIATDVEFPYLRNSDKQLLGSQVSNDNRYQALVEVVNGMKSTVESVGGGEIILEINASDLVTGNAEVYAPSELSEVTFAVVFDLSNLGNSLQLDEDTSIDLKEKSNIERFTILLTETEKLAGKQFVPSISPVGLTADEQTEMMRALVGNGYETVIVAQ